METLQLLSLALGSAWTSGINLYATVAALGIAGRMQMIDLPQGLEVLTDPLVIGMACVMYVVEFFADKVPYVDSGWDVLHTFIRIPAGAILAAKALGPMNPALELAAILAGGSLAFAAHATKATTRLAINVSPEPFSNWAASVGEDVMVLGSLWLIFHHPLIMLLLLALFIGLCLWLIPKMFGAARRGFQALRQRLRRKEVPDPNTP